MLLYEANVKSHTWGKRTTLCVCHCVRSNAAPESPSLCKVHVDKGELLQSAMESAERLKFPYKSCPNVVHHVHCTRKGNKGPVHANLWQHLSEAALSLQSGKASYHLHARGKTVKPSSMAVQSGTWKVSVQSHRLHFTCVSLVQVTAARICRRWSFYDQPHAFIDFCYWDYICRLLSPVVY